MLKLFSNLLADFEELKAKVEHVGNTATVSVANGVTYTQDELAAAEKSAFASIDPTTLSLSSAFEAGVKWMASRTAAAVTADSTSTATASDASAAAATVTATAADSTAADTTGATADTGTGTDAGTATGTEDASGSTAG